MRGLNCGQTSSKELLLPSKLLVCRLVIGQRNSDVAPQILAWKRFQRLRSLTVRWPSEALSKAVMRHKALDKVQIEEIKRPLWWVKQRYGCLFCPAMGVQEEDSTWTRLRELSIVDCYLECGQLWKLFSSMLKGKRGLKRLKLARVTSDECWEYHDICPVPAHLLGKLASTLTVLILDEVHLDSFQLQEFFQEFVKPTAVMEELTLSNIPAMRDLDPSTMASLLLTVPLRKLRLDSTNLGLLQTQLLMSAIGEGSHSLKQLAIYSDNNLRRLSGAILAAAFNRLEGVDLGNVNLDGQRVREVLARSREEEGGTNLKELVVDRYDVEGGHIFLPANHVRITNHVNVRIRSSKGWCQFVYLFDAHRNHATSRS